MSRPWIVGDQDQGALLPVDAADLLPPDHPAFEFQALIRELDLSTFEGAYRADGRGRPPYAPRLMLTLILYCRSKGLVSARQIAAACHDDLGARLITGNLYPDRSTIDRFLTVHAEAITALLPQTLKLGHAEGLVDVSVVAGDGTYLQANAAIGATVDEAGLQARITELERQLAAAQQVWAEQVATETVPAPPGLFDTDTDIAPARAAGTASTAAWRRVRTLSNLLAERQAALAHLQTHPAREVRDWQDRLERDQQRVAASTARLEAARAQAQATQTRREQATAAGRKLPGSAPASVDDHAHVRRARQALDKATTRAHATADARPPAGRINTTDPTSAIMPGKNAGFDQRHNIQALACKKQFVIAIGTHPSSNDKKALVELLRSGRANLDTAGITDPIGAALFDAGYASADNFTTNLPVELLLEAVEKEARQTGRQQDNTSTAAATWQAMADRFTDTDNRHLYKQRAAIIEPLFAQLFHRFGRYLLARGDQVKVELHLWAVTHNLQKISRQRQRHRGG